LKAFGFLIGGFVLASVLFAQEKVETKPFRSLNDAIQEKGGWQWQKNALAKLFAAERASLRGRFEKELWVYVDQKPERHYLSALFLSSDHYLNNAEARPFLALVLLQQGMYICEENKDKQSRLLHIRMLVTAALVSQEQNVSLLASRYKNRANDLTSKDGYLKGGWPAMSKEDKETFEAIK